MDHPHATLAELSAKTGVTVNRLRRPLARLISSGLVSRLAVAPPRYVPAPPDIAIDALALKRQEQLDALRSTARDLSRQLEAVPRGGPSSLIELVEGADGVEQTLARIQLAAQSEVCIVDCPPYLHGAPVDNSSQWNAMARGVRYRSIYDAHSIAEYGRGEEVLRYIAGGEQARSLPDLTMKMMIVDQRVALIPMSFTQPETGIRLLLHSSPLLNALVFCFERLWERATPLEPGAGTPGEPDGPSETDRQTLAMLAAGMKDHAIARALGITERTVTRRVTNLMQTLNATTRFQAALHAARRGWI